MFTGSALRWYVEGETEYGAIRQMLPESSRVGIELINLHGTLKNGKDNAALKLGEWLTEDRDFRRFSLITIDSDKPFDKPEKWDAANIKAIRQQVRAGNFVGGITVNSPDFEFANFTLEELLKVAAKLDPPTDPILLRSTDWTGIKTGKDFDVRYKQLSNAKSKLKSERWGAALADYAQRHPEYPQDHPQRTDDERERPIVRDIRAALWAWRSSYDRLLEDFMIDPVRLKRVSRPKP